MASHSSGAVWHARTGVAVFEEDDTHWIDGESNVSDEQIQPLPEDRQDQEGSEGEEADLRSCTMDAPNGSALRAVSAQLCPRFDPIDSNNTDMKDSFGDGLGVRIRMLLARGAAISVGAATDPEAMRGFSSSERSWVRGSFGGSVRAGAQRSLVGGNMPVLPPGGVFVVTLAYSPADGDEAVRGILTVEAEGIDAAEGRVDDAVLGTNLPPGCRPFVFSHQSTVRVLSVETLGGPLTKAARKR
jgi:hypothetical protein